MPPTKLGWYRVTLIDGTKWMVAVNHLGDGWWAYACVATELSYAPAKERTINRSLVVEWGPNLDDLEAECERLRRMVPTESPFPCECDEGFAYGHDPLCPRHGQSPVMQEYRAKFIPQAR